MTTGNRDKKLMAKGQKGRLTFLFFTSLFSFILAAAVHGIDVRADCPSNDGGLIADVSADGCPSAFLERGSETVNIALDQISRSERARVVARIDRQRIVRLAQDALEIAPISLRDDPAPAEFVSPGDFYSMGDYWWPNPDTPDGLPFVHRDGQSNPDNFVAHRLAVRRLRNAVAALAAAYALEGDERYARKAVQLLSVFFIDDDMRMNPHLLYAQAIPGRTQGRGIGIIDTLHLAEVPLAIEAIRQSKAMTPAVLNGLKRWFAAYADWMTTHPQGIREMNTQNNHAVAYWLQIVTFSRLTGDMEKLDKARRRWKEVIVPSQMEMDGSFPRELSRTKPYGYSIFQLDNMVLLCELLSNDEDNLWAYTLPDGRNMEKAMAFLYPYLKDKTQWPYLKDIEYFDQWPVRQPSLLLAGYALGKAEYLTLWKPLDPDPTNPEVRRNMAVTQPLLWLIQSEDVPLLRREHKGCLTRMALPYLFSDKRTPQALGCASYAAQSSSLEADFTTPPMRFKSQPMWHLNGTLENGQIQRQLQDARDRSGFSGVALLPVRQTRPEYLSEDYFERYGDILEACKSLGMDAIFYDDIGFPSGTAGSLLHDYYPEHLLSSLDMLQQEAEGPEKVVIDLPKGIHMAAVAMNTQTLERREMPLSPDKKKVVFNVPAGTWKLMVFTNVRQISRDRKATVDYLNPKSIEKFISLTYDQYYKRFPDHFGSTIKMTYFDDVGLRFAHRRNWTPIFNKAFKAKHGYCPALLYPALWHEIGPDTAAARVALLGFRAELLAEGFPRKVQQWAACHGVKSSGHAMGQYHAQPTFLGGDHIKFYKHVDVPMIDSIHYYGHGRPGFKLTSSASYTYDRPLTVVEIYGNYRGRFDSVMMYRSGMELLARGANMFIPHGMWYDPQSVSIPPLISNFNKDIAADLPGYNDWIGRCSLLLRGGRHMADIAVLYPIAAMQAHATFEPGIEGNVHPGLHVPPESDFNQLSDTLTGGVRRDFTFLHPEILDAKCTVEGAFLKLNNTRKYQRYKVLIIPGGRVIYWSNLQKINAFYEAGGSVVATTALPYQSAEFGHDEDVQRTIEHIFGVSPNGTLPDKKIITNKNANGGMAFFIPFLDEGGMALDSALKDAIPIADVRFGSDVPSFRHRPQPGSHPPADGEFSGMLSYIHKVKGGRDVYFFANSTDASIDTQVTLRGKLRLQSWCPHSGNICDLESVQLVKNGSPKTRARLRLEPVQSIFWVEGN